MGSTKRPRTAAGTAAPAHGTRLLVEQVRDQQRRLADISRRISETDRRLDGLVRPRRRGADGT